MANRRRGEIPLELDDRRFTLCLTLGGLAELESLFGVGDLDALGQRFSSGRLSSRDLLSLLRVGLRGGGHALSDEEIAALPIAGGIEAVVAAIVAMLAAAFGAGEGASDQNPQTPGR